MAVIEDVEMSKKPQPSAAQAATALATAPAEPQGNLPAGSSTTAAPGADAALTAGELVASNTGQDAHLNQGAPVDDDLGDGEIEGLWIRSVPEQGFRRFSMRFTREGHAVALSALTDDQIDELFDEPNLLVEQGVFSGLVG